MLPPKYNDETLVRRKLRLNAVMLAIGCVFEIAAILLFALGIVDWIPMAVVPTSSVAFVVNIVNCRRILRGERPWGEW